MENVTYSAEPVLDKGYVQLVEAWGSDQRVVEAARMSTQKGFVGWGSDGSCSVCGERDISRKNGRCQAVPGSVHTWDTTRPGDEKLLRFLYENKHHTPFEMAGMIIEVKAPLFVFREWHRHRTQSYNEMSARYIPLPDENYVPSLQRVLSGGQAKTNKQASGEPIGEADSLEWLAELADVYAHAQRVYESGLRRGIAKELARLPVPVARYSVMRASANLRNWLGFVLLRSAPGAQWEIREYSNRVENVLTTLFPRTMELFHESFPK